MQPHRFANNAWPYHVALQDVHNHEVSQHKDCQQPSLRQGQQDTDGAGDERPQYGDELEDKREYPEQEGIGKS